MLWRPLLSAATEALRRRNSYRFTARSPWTENRSPAAAIRFVPTGNTQGTGASGYTDKDGKYEVRDRGGNKGTPMGEYRVSIVKPGIADGVTTSTDPHPPAMPLAPSQVVSQKATVPEGGGTVDFSLKSKP